MEVLLAGMPNFQIALGKAMPAIELNHFGGVDVLRAGRLFPQSERVAAVGRQQQGLAENLPQMKGSFSQIGGGHIADNGKLDFAGSHFGDELRCAGFINGNDDPGMGFPEWPQNLGKQVRRYRGNDSKCSPAALKFPTPLKFRPKPFGLCQKVARVSEKKLPRHRGFDPAGLSQQKRLATLLFEGLNLLAKGWLGNMQPPGSRAQRTSLDNGNKGMKVT